LENIDRREKIFQAEVIEENDLKKGNIMGNR
jgi:hypothetical protein